MPDRIIRERARRSPTLDALSAEAERLHWRLTTACDDQGRFDADPRVLLAECFPLRVGSWTPARVERWRDELAAVGLILLYISGDRVYGCYPTWPVHQRQRDSRPRRPGPEDPSSQPYAKCDLRQLAANGGSARLARAPARRQASESRESLTTESRESCCAISPPDGGNLPHAAAAHHRNGTGPEQGPGEPSRPAVVFRIPAPISAALERAPVLGAVAR